MIPKNFEARKFGDAHQAKPLADWCAGIVYTANGQPSVSPHALAPGGKVFAEIGDWIIRAADGSVRIEQAGNQDGYCADCGMPLWWKDGTLITRSGRRWCYGKDEEHFGMERFHALPGMSQYVVRAREGQVCHCLDRAEPHIHQIILASVESV